jgi:hypothetical protein
LTSWLEKPPGLALDGDLLARDFEAAGFGGAAHGHFQLELAADLFAAPNADFGVRDDFEPLCRNLRAADSAIFSFQIHRAARYPRFAEMSTLLFQKQSFCQSRRGGNPKSEFRNKIQRCEWFE